MGRAPNTKAPVSKAAEGFDPSAVLSTWKKLNAFVSTTKDEEKLSQLLSKEREGQARESYMLRIYGRISLLRGLREREELTKASQNVSKTRRNRLRD